MVTVTTLPTLLFFAVILPSSVTSFYLMQALPYTSTSYHDNPAISPLNLMNSNAAILQLMTRDVPDLPESFSLSAKRFAYTNSPYDAVVGQLPIQRLLNTRFKMQ